MRSELFGAFLIFCSVRVRWLEGGGGQYFGRRHTQLYSMYVCTLCLWLTYTTRIIFLFWQTNSVKMRQKCTIYLRIINKKDMFCPQIKLRAEHSCAIILAHRSLPAQMAMRIKFSPQIINHIWFRRFFSCSGRVSICAPNIRCANKLAHYK